MSTATRVPETITTLRRRALRRRRSHDPAAIRALEPRQELVHPLQVRRRLHQCACPRTAVLPVVHPAHHRGGRTVERPASREVRASRHPDPDPGAARQRRRRHDAGSRATQQRSRRDRRPARVVARPARRDHRADHRDGSDRAGRQPYLRHRTRPARAAEVRSGAADGVDRRPALAARIPRHHRRRRARRVAGRGVPLERHVRDAVEDRSLAGRSHPRLGVLHRRPGARAATPAARVLVAGVRIRCVTCALAATSPACSRSTWPRARRSAPPTAR